MTQNIEVTGLFIYPVKSFAGIPLESSELDSMGLKNDRRWMVVSPEGKFLTQRTIPQMALIRTSLDNGKLTLKKQGMDDHQVPEASTLSEIMEVTIWRDTLQVQRIGDASDAWLSQALGVECKLVYIADDVQRQCNLDYAQQGDRTGFADAYPMLLISEDSLQDLNQRLDHPVEMRRFRPNIVIKGCEAFAEDKFEAFTIANLDMRGVKLCDRCPMPTVDPDKGERDGQEPIATLMKYRKWDNKVFFGMNVIHQQQGKITIGDKLVLKA
jgi:hypothetical protein